MVLQWGRGCAVQGLASRVWNCDEFSSGRGRRQGSYGASPEVQKNRVVLLFSGYLLVSWRSFTLGIYKGYLTLKGGP